MGYEFIEIERSGPVGILRLNRPDTLNAMSLEMVEELAAGLTELEGSARAIVLTGRGRAFCSGGNLGDMSTTGDMDLGANLESHVNPLMTRLRDLSVPWITAVRGAAAGVGCALALAADMIVASETAYFLQAFSAVGLVPDGGSTYLLARTLGRPRAMEMMLLAERIPAARALEWGLINRVVPDAALETGALALAERLANGPCSLAMTRKLVWHALDNDLASALRQERAEQNIAGRTADAGEGIAAFFGKRTAQFSGA